MSDRQAAHYDAQAEIARLHRDVAALLAALEPFARAGEFSRRHNIRIADYLIGGDVVIRWEDYERARAAWAGKR